MRLQSDTAFLGALTNVPSGSYTVQVTLSSPEITFLNDTGAPITGKRRAMSGHICLHCDSHGVGTPRSALVTFNATASGQQGIEIDFNLKMPSRSRAELCPSISIPPLPTRGVFTAFTLPARMPNLGTNQLELIEDFTGVVSISGSTVTITSPTRGVLSATVTSSSFFDQSPVPTNLCPSAPNNCAAAGQNASVDAFLKSDGTLELKEFEPLNSTQQDFVEGTVFSIDSNSSTQFSIAVTDKVQLATNSLIGDSTLAISSP